MTWLGRKVNADGVRVYEEKVKAIRALPPPTSVKQVQKFLGALNYNRQSIKGVANIATPLYSLLKKGVKFDWTQDCQKRFQELKRANCTM